MNSRVLLAAALLATFVATGAAQVKWQKSYDAAAKLAQKSKKLMVIDFSSTY